MNGQRKSLNCYGELNISLPQSGEFQLRPNILTRETNLDNLKVQVMGTSTNIIDCSMSGQNIMVSLIDTIEHINCMTEIFVEDKSHFNVSCRDTIITCATDLANSMLNSLLTINDNCLTINDIDISYADLKDASFNPNGDTISLYQRTWILEDKMSGQIETCTSRLYLKDFDIHSIVFPSDTTIYCGQNPRDSTITGLPNSNNILLGQQCNVAIITSIIDTFPKSCTESKYIRSWTAYNWNTNDTARSIQTIVLKDTSTIQVAGSEPLQIGSAGSSCSARYIIGSATFSSGCLATNLSQNDVTVIVDGIDYYEVADTITVDTGMHEIIYVLKQSLNCNRKFISDTLVFRHDDNTKPIINQRDFWSFTVPITSLIVVDSLFDKVPVTSCRPTRFLAAKSNTAPLTFVNQLTFSYAESLLDSVKLNVIAINDLGVSSDTICVYVKPRDKEAPELILNDSISINLNADSLVILDSTIFLMFLADNSGIIQSLSITGSGTGFSGSGSALMGGSGWPILTSTGFISFSCDDVGDYFATITACDPSNNCTTMQTMFSITDTLGICPSSSNLNSTYQGRFTDIYDTPMKNVKIMVDNGGETILVREAGDDGIVVIENLKPDSVLYQFDFSYDTIWNKGVDVGDLNLLQSYLLGMMPNPDTLFLIASDVDNNNAIGAIDFIELQKVFLNQPSTVTTMVEPWAFAIKNETALMKLSNPNIQDIIFPEGVSKFEYIVIKRGDLNMNAPVNAHSAPRSRKELLFEKQTTDNGIYRIKLNTSDLEYDAVQFCLSIDSEIIKKITASGYNVEILDDEILFYIYQPDADPSDILIDLKEPIQEVELGDSWAAKAYKRDQNYRLELREVYKEIITDNRISIYSNPFSESLTIDLSHIAEIENLSGILLIHDELGRKVYQRNISNLTQASVLINDANNWLSGIYVVTLSAENKVYSTYIVKK